MATNASKILAGIGAGGTTGTSLAWVGPTSATAPTNATASLATFHDIGYCTTDGLTVGDATSSNVIQAYGTTAPVRVLITSEVQTFHVSGLESSTYALEVYHKLAIGSVTPTTGAFTITDVANAGRQLYSFVFDVVDGTNHLRAYVPNCEVTDKDDLQIQAGQPVTYGFTLTAYPDASGNVVKWFYVVAADVS